MEKAWKLKSRLGLKDQMRLEAWRQDRAKDEIATLRAMHERWPDDRQTLRDLAIAVWKYWDFGEASVLFEKGLHLYPDDPVFGGPSHLYALVCMGRTEDALRATNSFVKRHPKDPISWDELGRRYLAQGLPDSAEAAFHKAVELDPKWSPENFSYCAYQRGDLRDAISIVERILEQENLSAERRWTLIVLSPFSMCLASLYIEAGCHQKARDVIREYTVMPDMNMAEFRLLIAMGRAQEACELYEQWLKSDSLNDYPRPLGRALAMLGDVKGAREAAKNLSGKEMGMADYDALEIEAQAALADHDPKTALEFLGKLKRRGIPFGGYIDIDYRTALAHAYRMQGRFGDAAEVHKGLLRIYGGHALSHYELGTIYDEMKRPADAKKEYTKFLEMWSEADEGLPQLIDARKRLAAL